MRASLQFYSVLLSLILTPILQCQGRAEHSILVGNMFTRTDVSSVAAITKDIRDMSHQCREGNLLEAQKIYSEGKHAPHSLKYLATHADYLNSDITFAFQMYGLVGGRNNIEDTQDPENQHFASMYVEQLFDDGKCIGAVYAAQHLVLWMHVSYELWDVVKKCAISADPEYDNEVAGIGDMKAEADEIVAYWIGGLQRKSGSQGTDGHSLYSMANEVGTFFGTVSIGGARANTNIARSYETISGMLSRDDACGEYAKTVEAMWPTVQELMKQLMVPQMQSLIRAMLEDNIEMVGIISRIVVPQISQCRLSTYRILKETFLDNEYDSSKFHKTLKVLQSSYSCLGLTCRDIGMPQYSGDNSLSCLDADLVDLAGYPTSTDVKEQSQIDLDIYQINILTQFDNEVYWDMAKMMYMHGKNSMQIKSFEEDDDDDGSIAENLRSLQSLAISGTRAGVYFYDEFTNYFDDPNYADTAIMEAFNEEGRFGDRPRDQRATVIEVTIQSQLMYMHVLSELKDATNDCAKGDRFDNAGNADSWDEVASYIIGSLEGEGVGGSDHFDDGQMLWGLGNSRCIEFSRQNEKNYAIVNSGIETLLLAGKGQLVARNCKHLERTATRIAHLLLVPIIQSVVKYAIVNEFESWDVPDTDIAAGETYANALIPILNRYSVDSADTVKRNMVAKNFQALVADGPQAVADSFLALTNEFEFQCEYIGQSFEVDACLNYKYQSVDKSITSRAIKSKSSFIFSTMLLSMGAFMILV